MIYGWMGLAKIYGLIDYLHFYVPLDNLSLLSKSTDKRV
jgi:hypothetical protein